MVQLNWWKWLAIIAFLGCVALLMALVAVVTSHFLQPVEQQIHMSDERLIGKWQSDVDRIIADLREARPVDETQEAKLRQLFGKLRVTYTPAVLTTELDGSIESYGYKVLGRDKHSVVIQEIDTNPSTPDPLEILKLSTFSIIHFDGPNSYWLRSKVGGEPEWFKRVE